MAWTVPEITPADEPFAGDERAMLDSRRSARATARRRRCAAVTWG